MERRGGPNATGATAPGLERIVKEGRTGDGAVFPRTSYDGRGLAVFSPILTEPRTARRAFGLPEAGRLMVFGGPAQGQDGEWYAGALRGWPAFLTTGRYEGAGLGASPHGLQDAGGIRTARPTGSAAAVGWW